MLQSAQAVGAPSPVDFLVVGHVARDLVHVHFSHDPETHGDPDLIHGDYLLGGTVSFAAVTAVRLGRQPTVITRAAGDMDFSALPGQVDVHVLPSPSTTTFANIYTGQGRVQFCHTPALPITAQDIPIGLRSPRIVLMGPIANEVSPDVAAVFAPHTLVAAVPQGWMRHWDERGRVWSKPWDSYGLIAPYLDVLILSLEDIDRDLTRLDLFCADIPLVILTEYRDGSTVYERRVDGERIATKIPPRPAQEVDPTGAGDIFATAFLLRFQETDDPIESAYFANVTASFGVEADGVAGIPSRQQVLAYMRDHPL